MPLAQRIADALSQIPNVAAVALGGSWAAGRAKPDSDIDLGVYYRGVPRPPIKALRELAVDLDDRHAPVVADFDEWGPWINGGAWLEVEGRRVDWLWRDADRVMRIINECRAGYITCDYQPGHPHGFHNYVYLAETYYCRPLVDRANTIGTLKERVAEYPPRMREAIVRRYQWEGEWTLSMARKAAEPVDIAYVEGSLYRSIACLVQVLFAVNERYFLNEKGSVQAVESFELHPDGFAGTVASILTLENTAESLRGSLDAARDLAVQVRQLVTGSIDRDLEESD